MGRLTTALDAAAQLLLRALQLQALWLIGTLAGGVILGWAPATMVAADAVRRAERGQRTTFRHASRIWRSTFWRSQVTLGPPAALLVLGIGALSAGDAPLVVRLPAGLATIALLAAMVHIPLLDLRYRVPAPAVLARGALLSLAQAHTTVLLGAVLVLWGAVMLSLPGLIPFLGAGVPLLVSQHLVGRTLDRNEELLASEAHERPRGTTRPREAVDTSFPRAIPQSPVHPAPVPRL
jgi:uncharacterized membrane protein YesL